MAQPFVKKLKPNAEEQYRDMLEEVDPELGLSTNIPNNATLLAVEIMKIREYFEVKRVPGLAGQKREIDAVDKEEQLWVDKLFNIVQTPGKYATKRPKAKSSFAQYIKKITDRQKLTANSYVDYLSNMSKDYKAANNPNLNFAPKTEDEYVVLEETIKQVVSDFVKNNHERPTTFNQYVALDRLAKDLAQKEINELREIPNFDEDDDDTEPIVPEPILSEPIDDGPIDDGHIYDYCQGEGDDVFYVEVDNCS